jgi:hypothetical protein
MSSKGLRSLDFRRGSWFTDLHSNDTNKNRLFERQIFFDENSALDRYLTFLASITVAQYTFQTFHFSYLHMMLICRESGQCGNSCKLHDAHAVFFVMYIHISIKI